MAATAKVTPIKPAGFVIDMGVPIPRNGGRIADPDGVTARLRTLAAAEIGASVFLPGRKPATMGRDLASARLSTGWYASRAVEGGVRVWKVAEPKPS